MSKKLTLSLTISASYLILISMIGLTWSFMGFNSQHPDFNAQTIGYKMGAYAREHTFNILFLIAGVAILKKKEWGRMLAMVSLVVGTLYTANAFAWGYVQGEPSNEIKVISLIIVGVWNGLWFYLLAKRSSRLAMT